ncbi:uncharacterized protein TNCV_1433331 [Trichonephila clavipes]|nr:uncharacterized protein TNCV_1433331 [Trichonephila clavipes]
MGDLTYAQKADIHYMNGRATGNGRAVLRMYHVQFPDRRMLDQRIFQRLHRQLRETRSFYVSRHNAGRRRAVRSQRRSELITIRKGLQFTCEAEVQFQDVWILTDRCALVQHLSNWASIGDQTKLDILKLLDRISSNHRVHFQWTPSHVVIDGNEKVNFIARTAVEEGVSLTGSFTFSELSSLKKIELNQLERTPPSIGRNSGTSEEIQDVHSGREDNVEVGQPPRSYNRSFEHHTGGRTFWLGSTPIFEGEHPRGGQGSLNSLPLPPTSQEDRWLDSF